MLRVTPRAHIHRGDGNSLLVPLRRFQESVPPGPLGGKWGLRGPDGLPAVTASGRPMIWSRAERGGCCSLCQHRGEAKGTELAAVASWGPSQPTPNSLLLCQTRGSPTPTQLGAGQAVPPRRGMADGMPVTRGGWPTTAGRAVLGPGARPFTFPPRKQELHQREQAPETRGPGQGSQTTKSWSQVALGLSPSPPPGRSWHPPENTGK